MSITEPIRRSDEVKRMVDYYLEREEMRNCCLISFGLYSALRISDMLGLKWKDVFDIEKNKFKVRISLVEGKTKKSKRLALNARVIEIFSLYKDTIDGFSDELYIFKSRKGKNSPITREQAYKIVKRASLEIGLEGRISCHSLRKTFGYHAWRQGTPPAVLMNIYNHSSFRVTERYLCIDQDDRDEIYMNIKFYDEE